MNKIYIFLIFFLTASCTPKIKVDPIKNFNVERYLGDWYEIVRIDHSFEKNCEGSMATYSKRNDGGINVKNQCYIGGKHKVSNGRAYFKELSNIGNLKVTFFWPFYGSYKIAYLDENYQYSLVLSDTNDYLWILSRNKTLDKEIVEKLLKKSKELGVDISKVIYNKIKA